ncbi:MAG: Rrf2 family transcriptional regulator [Opitutales bacterium]|nr:Rrf2 family transcriptional regulator [Opitutales bacterium]
MNVLSQTTGYAITALAHLAASPAASLLVREIAAATDIPPPYLAKVVQRLAAAGIVDSKRGYRGGIRMAAPPETITIAQIDKAVDLQRVPDRCLLGMTDCSDARDCPAHSFWVNQRKQIRQRLEVLTLADIVAFEARRAGRASTENIEALAVESTQSR